MVRVVVITDRALCGGEAMLARARAILAAVPRGTVRVQVREKDLDGGPLLALVRDLRAVTRAAGAELWVNDRIDVALAAGADGVQLPEVGMAVADARALIGNRLAIGASRHAPEAARTAAAEGADLVQLGPIFATPSKAAYGAPLGADALRGLPVPVVAVGGIDSPARAREAFAAGATAVAVIRAAWTGDDPGGAIAALLQG